MPECKYKITVEHIIDGKTDYAFEIVHHLPGDNVQLLASVSAALDFQSADTIKRLYTNPEFDPAIKAEWEKLSEYLETRKKV